MGYKLTDDEIPDELVIARREKIAEGRRRWNAANPGRREAAGSAWWQRNRKSSSVRSRRRQLLLRDRYGVTQEGYDAMFASQGGVCAVCGLAESVTTSEGDTCNLSVDHCHSTGIVRGLLCRKCNQMLGHSGDSVSVLRSAADYLERTSKNAA